MNDHWKSVAILVLVVALTASSLSFHIYHAYQFEEAVHTEIDLAASSADAGTMQEHLEEARDGLDEVGYEGGQYAYLGQTPSSNTTVKRSILDTYIDRAGHIEQTSNETAESVALIDMREQLNADPSSSLGLDTYGEYIHGHPLLFVTGHPLSVAFQMMLFIVSAFRLVGRVFD